MIKKISVSLFNIFCLVVFLIGCSPSQAVDYSVSDNWAILPSSIQKEVDVFLICPTVDKGAGERYNMSLEDKENKVSFVGALNMETGIYSEVSNVFAPYYRQITLSAYNNEGQSAYLDIAYQDVKAAFLEYFETRNQGRPFILAGFSQGSQMGLMLMEDLFDDTKYSDKLVAAYLMGWSVYDETLAKCPWIKMATGEADTGCVITFNSESVDIASSFVIPAGKRALAINPLNWKTDATPADASQNLGACFTNYAGEIKQEIPHLTGAYLDTTRGSLKVPDVTPQAYPPILPLFSSGEYHLYDYQFFYRNLQKNVADRVSAYYAR